MMRRQDRAVRQAVKHWSASKRAESVYTMAILQILAAAHRGVLLVVEREHLATKDVHVDAPPPPPGLGAPLMKRLATWMKPRVEDAFDRMSRDVSSSTQAAAALYGIHVQHVAGVDSVIEHARARNVDLVTNATEDFLDDIREVLEESEGETPETIRELLEDRVGVSRSRGALIARDQTLKLNSQVSQYRMRSAGVARYTWSGSLDERERPMHRELEGQVFLWDDPPETNDDGDRNHPGEDYQCRCVGIPFIEELEEGDDEADAEPDDDQDIAAEE